MYNSIYKKLSKDREKLRNRKKLESKRNKKYRESVNGWLSHVLAQMKKRAKSKGLEVSVDREYLRSLLLDKCPFTGLKLVRHRGVLAPDSVSFDRINNDLGYVEGNIQCVSMSYNTGKRDRKWGEDV